MICSPDEFEHGGETSLTDPDNPTIVRLRPNHHLGDTLAGFGHLFRIFIVQLAQDGPEPDQRRRVLVACQ